MELYLIRHPRTDVDTDVCYGYTDLPLAEPPEPAAERLRPLLPSDYALYASPLQRCTALAELLGSPRLDARLEEIDFGDWEMQRFAAIGQAALDRWAADPAGFRPPGGESCADMAARVLNFLADLRADPPELPVVVVAHGGPLRALLGHLLGLPMDRWLALDFAFGAVSKLCLERWGAQLKWFNR